VFAHYADMPADKMRDSLASVIENVVSSRREKSHSDDLRSYQCAKRDFYAGRSRVSSKRSHTRTRGFSSSRINDAAQSFSLPAKGNSLVSLGSDAEGNALTKDRIL